MAVFDFRRIAAIVRDGWESHKTTGESDVDGVARSVADHPDPTLAVIIHFPIERCSRRYAPPWHRAEIIDLVAYAANKRSSG